MFRVQMEITERNRNKKNRRNEGNEKERVGGC